MSKSNQAPPMTATLMGRLFVVPALVVCVLLGVAVVVVFFGASSIEKPETTQDLLALIESDSGDRNAAGMMLLPGAKEAWLAAQELAIRLADKEKYVEPQEIEPMAQRIITILKEDRTRFRNTESAGRVQERGQARRLFLITALGRLQTPTAVEPLIELLQDQDAKTRQFSLKALAEMSEVSEARAAVGRIYPLLFDPDPAVQIVSALAVAALADRGDPTAIRELAQKLESEPEIQWNAAMALARLGSRRGKLVLLNMLHRPFWEGPAGELDYQEADGRRVRRKLTEAEVAGRLSAAIDAAAFLDDEELKDLIAELNRDDKSHVVREAARVALEKMTAEKGRRGVTEAFRDLAGARG